MSARPPGLGRAARLLGLGGPARAPPLGVTDTWRSASTRRRRCCAWASRSSSRKPARSCAGRRPAQPWSCGGSSGPSSSAPYGLRLAGPYYQAENRPRCPRLTRRGLGGRFELVATVRRGESNPVRPLLHDAGDGSRRLFRPVSVARVGTRRATRQDFGRILGGERALAVGPGVLASGRSPPFVGEVLDAASRRRRRSSSSSRSMTKLASVATFGRPTTRPTRWS